MSRKRTRHRVISDAPHVFTGGSLAPFKLAPKYLKLTNGTDKPATVTVFVGRDATR